MQPEWSIAKIGVNEPVDSVLALAGARVVEDLVALASLFASSQPELLQGRPVFLNPTFGEASRLLGGADADLIVAHGLIDIKTVQRAVLGKSTLWQLLGYLLADTENVFNIEEVGLYFSRHGVRVTWSVPEFLSTLAGEIGTWARHEINSFPCSGKCSGHPQGTRGRDRQ